MKRKAMVMVALVFLAAGFAGPTWGEVEFKPFGFSALYGQWLHRTPHTSINTLAAGSRTITNELFFDYRVRLGFDFIPEKKTKLTLQLEFDCQPTASELGTSQAGARGGRNLLCAQNADVTGVEVKWAYFDAPLPESLFGDTTFRFGIQPYTLRGAPQGFFFADDFGLTLTHKTGPLTGNVFYIPIIERDRDSTPGIEIPGSTDADLYGTHATYKLPRDTVGLHFLFKNDRTEGRLGSPASRIFQSNLRDPSLPGAAALTSANFRDAGRGDVGIDSFQGFWLGLYDDGKVESPFGAFAYSLDLIGFLGRTERNCEDRPGGVCTVTLAGQPSRTFDGANLHHTGWYVRGALTYTPTAFKAFDIGISGWYTSGNDEAETFATGNTKAFIGPGTGNVAQVTNAAGTVFFTGGEGIGTFRGFAYETLAVGSAFIRNHDVGMFGTAFAHLFGRWRATRWLTTTVGGLYIWDTNRNGDAFDGVADNPLRRSNMDRDDDVIGQEVYVKFNFKVTERVGYGIDFGYLFAGSALGGEPGVDNRRAKNAAAMQHLWTLRF